MEKNNNMWTFNENHDLVEIKVEIESTIGNDGKKTLKVVSERVVPTEERVSEFFSMPKDLQKMLFAGYASTSIEEGEVWDSYVVEICNRLKVRLEGMEDNGYPLVKTQWGIPTKQIEELFK